MGKASYKKQPSCVWLLLFIEQCSQIVSRQLINKAWSAKFREGQRLLNSGTQHKALRLPTPGGMDGAGTYNREMQEMQTYFAEGRSQISMKSAGFGYTCSRTFLLYSLTPSSSKTSCPKERSDLFWASTRFSQAFGWKLYLLKIHTNKEGFMWFGI